MNNASNALLILAYLLILVREKRKTRNNLFVIDTKLASFAFICGLKSPSKFAYLR
jgi:hypothetical protein